jgi:hypothetical protein
VRHYPQLIDLVPKRRHEQFLQGVYRQCPRSPCCPPAERRRSRWAVAAAVGPG